MTTETRNLKDVYEFIQNGGHAYLVLRNGGYEILDNASGTWDQYDSLSFTVSPEHIKNLRFEDGALYFDGYFGERMVAPGAAVEVVREITQAEADERNRRSLWGDIVPGKVVRVHMRVKPEHFLFAYLEIATAKGVRPRIDWPKKT